MAGAIGYARVSTEEQMRENNSLAVQRKKIKHYCEQNNLELMKVIEVSESARTMDRDGLQELLAYCRQNRRKISHVVVSELSRLARNVQHQGQIVAVLKKLGMTLDSIDEPLTDDSSMGEFVRNLLGSVNQLFSDALSERTRYRMQEGVKAGRFLWPAPVGYVNKNKKLYPDPARAPLVREAFEMMASGRYPTADAVLKIVTAMGLKTKKGRPLTKQTFSRMLTNPIYAGWVVSGDLKVRGAHESLISDQLFDAVQARLKPKTTVQRKLNDDFPLRGVVRCATCGNRLTAGWVKGRSERYARYWCWTKGCGAVGIGRDDLERQFVGLLSRMEPTAELIDQLPKKIAVQWKERKERIAAEARRLSNSLAEQDTLNQKAITAKVNQEISVEDFETLKKVIGEKRIAIQDAITVLDSERSTMEEMLKQANAQAVDLMSAWNKGNINQRQELVRAFFPEGLVFSHELKFFEPANAVITEMVMRFLNTLDVNGVPKHSEFEPASGVCVEG